MVFDCKNHIIQSESLQSTALPHLGDEQKNDSKVRLTTEMIVLQSTDRL